MAPKADRLGDVVAQACLSVARMVRVVEKTHNSKTVEALIVRQHLEKVSAEAIDSMMDEIQGACTPADIWWVEKKISAHISHERGQGLWCPCQATQLCVRLSHGKGWVEQQVI